MDKIQELRKKLIKSAKNQVQEKYSETDVHLIKAVNLLEDIDSIVNLLVEQLREWHSTHFPELNEIVKENDDYSELVSTIGKREKFTQKAVKLIINDEYLIEKIVNSAQNSMGAPLTQKDEVQIRALALNCANLKKERESLTNYIDEYMKKELPNFAEIAGSIIGAKILAKIGGKKRLVMMPASTIQLVGAEKALFLHFKTGVKGPKYGYLYQHPLVKSTKAEHKGKIARSIAAKLAIALKEDYFGDKNIADELKAKLEARAKELLERQEDPKKTAERKRKANQIERPIGFPKRNDSPRKAFGRGTSFGNRDDKPRRSFGDRDKPRGNFGNKDYKPRDRNSNDTPRKPYSERNDKPRGNFSTEKPSFRRDSENNRSFGNRDKPRRSFGDRDKPRGNFGNKEYKPKDNYRDRNSNDTPRKPYSERNDKPRSTSFGNRNDKPRGSFGDRSRPKNNDSKRGNKPKSDYKRDDSGKPRRIASKFDAKKGKSNFNKKSGNKKWFGWNQKN